MSKFINTAIAATIALAIAVPAGMQQAHAGKNGKYIALGVAAGIVGTAIVAKQRRKRAVRRASAQSEWDRHVLACHRAYRSYDERSDTWIDKYGRVRVCRK